MIYNYGRQHMEIKLTDQQKIYAMKIGLERTIGDGRSERFLKDRRWNEHSHIADLVQSIHSAGSELAAAYALGHNNFELTVHTFKQADIGTDIQVRWTNRHYNLIVRPADDDTQKYVFVTGDLDLGYYVHGWLYGMDAKVPMFYKNPQGRGDAWFVPKTFLNDINTIEGDYYDN